jgi:hypothetical protein
MKKEQLVIVGLIVLCGLGLVLFGRTKPGPDPPASEQIAEALKQQKVPVHVFVRAKTAEGRAFVAEVKRAIAQTEPKRVRLVVLDADDPNEAGTVAQVAGRRGPQTGDPGGPGKAPD